MFFSKSAIFAVAILTFVCLFDASSGMPSIGHFGKRFDAMSGLDYISICLNNCGQCKKMFAGYFKSESCAESCLKFNGRAIPDCTDEASIAPFLNNLE